MNQFLISCGRISAPESPKIDLSPGPGSSLSISCLNTKRVFQTYFIVKVVGESKQLRISPGFTPLLSNLRRLVSRRAYSFSWRNSHADSMHRDYYWCFWRVMWFPAALTRKTGVRLVSTSESIFVHFLNFLGVGRDSLNRFVGWN